MALIRSPFKEAIGPSTVPKSSSGKVKYDAAPAPGLPGRDGGLLKEVTFDTNAGSPKLSGPVKRSPFKDAVS